MRAAAALLVFLAAVARPARAQEAAASARPAGAARAPDSALTTPVRFPIRPWPDGVGAGAAVAAAAVPLVWPNAFPHATCSPCNPSSLWGLDRDAVGPVRAAANAFSSVTLGAEAVMGALFLAASRRGEGTGPFVEDAVVIAEAVSATAAATEWTKILFHRARPYLYLASGSPPTPTADDGRSFPSSHASIAFAAAAAYASLLNRRGIAGRHKTDIALLFAAAAATGALRVLAHKHFPTDVAAGAALGFAIGWTIPAIHPTLP